MTHHFPSRVDLLVATLAEVDRRRSSRITAHTDLDPSDRLKATLLELLPMDTARLDEQRVWISLCTTGIPELRDEVRRQMVKRDRTIGSLVDAARGLTGDDTVTFELIALIDGLSHRLAIDTTPKARRSARDVLDRALGTLAMVARKPAR